MRRFFPVVIAGFVFLLVVSFAMTNSASEKQTSELKQTACDADYLSDYVYDGNEIAVFDGEEVDVPEIAEVPLPSNVLAYATGEKWVEVDLSDQMIYAWQGDQKVMESKISSGLPWWPTPVGEYRVWIKLRATKMEGGEGKYYYYLPNVPYVMFFEGEGVPGWKGYGLHGAYWHNEFGTPRSHGCVNLPVDFSAQLYEWIGPVMPEGKNVVRATEDNPGSRIVIHE